jgi:hypothetical protein
MFFLLKRVNRRVERPSIVENLSVYPVTAEKSHCHSRANQNELISSMKRIKERRALYYSKKDNRPKI